MGRGRWSHKTALRCILGGDGTYAGRQGHSGHAHQTRQPNRALGHTRPPNSKNDLDFDILHKVGFWSVCLDWIRRQAIEYFEGQPASYTHKRRAGCNSSGCVSHTTSCLSLVDLGCSSPVAIWFSLLKALPYPFFASPLAYQIRSVRRTTVTPDPTPFGISHNTTLLVKGEIMTCLSWIYHFTHRLRWTCLSVR